MMDNKQTDKTSASAKEQGEIIGREEHVDKTIRAEEEKTTAQKAEAAKNAPPMDTADRGIPSHPEDNPKTDPTAAVSNKFVQHERLDDAPAVKAAKEGDADDNGCSAVIALVAQSQSRGLLIEPGEVLRVAEGCTGSLKDELVHVANQHIANNVLMQPGVVATVAGKHADQNTGAGDAAEAEKADDNKDAPRKRTERKSAKTDGARKK